MRRRFINYPKRYGRTLSAYDRYYSRPNKDTVRRKTEKSGLIKQFRGLEPETKKGIFAVLVILLAIIILLSLFNLAGPASAYINKYLAVVFGVGIWYTPFILLILGYFLARNKKYEMKSINYLSSILIILSLNSLIHIIKYSQNLLPAAQLGFGGGLVGLSLSWPIQRVLGFWASLVIIFAILVVSLMLFFNTSLAQVFSKGEAVKSFWQSLRNLIVKYRIKKAQNANQAVAEEPAESAEGDTGEPAFAQRTVAVPMEVESSDGKVEDTNGNGAKTARELDLGVSKWRQKKVDLPLSLLNGKAGKPTSGDIKAKQLIIQKTLENFSIPVEMGEVNVGPTVTQFTLKPAEGIKLSRIVGLSDNLALALAAHPIRMEAPIPGFPLVGVEVPNQTKAIVPLREVIDSDEFRKRKSNLMIALGKDVKGQPWLADLSKMPHLMIAGATGSGKSVCINSIIISMLYQNSPGDLRFILVDPKRVELPIYNGIPHLITPVITEVKKTVNALKWAIGEMEKRFDMLSKFHKRDIKSFNRDIEEKMPYIIIIIDELADLMAASGAEVEASIIRLAQMSRAVGIHLIVATQRPSVDILTGLIKANIPSRIAFSVASLVDSRTILDASGAEKLIGCGDMLYSSAELSKPKRLQGAFVSDNEIKQIIDYLREQAEPDYIEEVTEKAKTGSAFGGADDNDGDSLLPEAREVIIQAGKASASLLQRRLRVGYARAARILDLLEKQGFIGPADGAKPREILNKGSVGSKIDSASEAAQDMITEDDFTEDEDVGDENFEEEKY